MKKQPKKTAKKKKVVKSKKEMITEIQYRPRVDLLHVQFPSEDMNLMVAKINEIIKHVN